MARTVAELPKGKRLTDFISLGVIAKQFPVRKIQAILDATGRQTQRRRQLPAPQRHSWPLCAGKKGSGVFSQFPGRLVASLAR